jgi:hypothetical protein
MKAEHVILCVSREPVTSQVLFFRLDMVVGFAYEGLQVYNNFHAAP